MDNKREFCVETPMGILRVYAKHDTDSAEDYPGVYIDLIRPGTERTDSDPVCTVEYDSGERRIQTVAFDAEMDAPVEVIVYDWEEKENADNSCGDPQ